MTTIVGFMPTAATIPYAGFVAFLPRFLADGCLRGYGWFFYGVVHLRSPVFRLPFTYQRHFVGARNFWYVGRRIFGARNKLFLLRSIDR